MMGLRVLQTFLTAAEKLNFSRTADQLGYSQAAVTIQIKQLEEELGVRLFDRIGKNVFLTEDGRQFLIHAQRICRDVEEAAEAVRHSESYDGVIRIGMSESIYSDLFPDSLIRFHRQHPRIQLVTRTGMREYLLGCLLRNELDLAYLIDCPLMDQTWYGRVVSRESIRFVCAAGHPLSSKPDLNIHDVLASEILFTELYEGYGYALSQRLAQRGLTLTPWLETGSTTMLRELVRLGQGISYLPDFVIREAVKNGSLSVLPLPEFEVDVCRQILWHKQKYLTRPMQDLIELLVHT